MLVNSVIDLKRRAGRVVEGTSLLRKHTGLNLYRGFESLALRQQVIKILFYLFVSQQRRPVRPLGLAYHSLFA